MATARYKLVDQNVAMYYHVVSRCVRRSYLFGRDRRTRRDYGHRKRWVVERFTHLAKYFALEVHAYCVMSNHYHLVVYFDPTAPWSWSDADVAERWVSCFPPRSEKQKDLLKQVVMGDPDWLARARRKFGDMGDFMKSLNQPIARRANEEDGMSGHFFEDRYYSGALLDEEAVLASMMYVDLNPIRANIATNLTEIRNASIDERVRANRKSNLRKAIDPLVSGLEDSSKLSMPLEEYLQLARSLIDEHRDALRAARSQRKQSKWYSRMMAIQRPQRAHGSIDRLRSWVEERGMRLQEQAL